MYFNTIQIVSINNIAAPSINQSSTFSPRMLRVRLTDGTTNVYALEYEPIPKLSYCFVLRVDFLDWKPLQEQK